MVNNSIIKTLLYPLSKIFGLGVYFRNTLFDHGLIKSQSFPIPIICVGNLSVGGTGKTPHIEYLVTLLKQKYRVAVVSRGYKRKSKGMQISSTQSTPEQLGDEPFQIFAKNPEITVVADSNRCRAITHLLQLPIPPQVILLDDAYQHRYVSAGLNILLTDFNQPFYADHLMPYGRLREPAKNKNRANAIIVTKTPEDTDCDNLQHIAQKIAPSKEQLLFFSSLKNPAPRNIFTQEIADLDADTEILLATGVANPKPIEATVSSRYFLNSTLHFSDHCNFGPNEIDKIVRKFNSIQNNKKAILVTEKDAVKLRNSPALKESLKDFIYYLPLEIVFLQSETNKFNQFIFDYVAENKRNS